MLCSINYTLTNRVMYLAQIIIKGNEMINDVGKKKDEHINELK